MPSRVFKTIRAVEYSELMFLFLILGGALGAWTVPLSRVLDAHGLHAIKPFAFAASAVAAFVSPLIFGAMADRHASPARVLGGLSLASAGAMALATTAIMLGWNRWIVLVLIQFYSLCVSPTFGLASTIAFSRVVDSKKEFGPIRAMATFGWMAGCWLISALRADESPVAGYTGAGMWLVVAGFTLFFAGPESLRAAGPVSWRQRLGLDALTLLKHRDHRVVFVTTALFAVPLAGFYPYTPTHLRELGFERTSAWMSIGQVTEIIGMFSLGALLLRWRLKWIFTFGLVFGVVRFALCALDRKWWLIAGVTLHGCSFTLVLITAQIYLDQRIDPAWRARGQSLLTLMNGGFGNLIGYLGVGWWFNGCTTDDLTRWPRFWSGLSVTVAAVMIYFLVAYRGKGVGLHPAPETQEALKKSSSFSSTSPTV